MLDNKSFLDFYYLYFTFISNAIIFIISSKSSGSNSIGVVVVFVGYCWLCNMLVIFSMKPVSIMHYNTLRTHITLYDAL